jgi:hypothetical protein
MMKRILAIVMALVLVLSALTACSSKSNENAPSGKDASASFDPSQVKTMGDAFAYEDDEQKQEACSETEYIFVFPVGDVYYRAVAELPKDVSDEIWAIDFEDENRDQKVRDLVSPLPLTSLENLNELIPTQDELDQLVGKTGQDLFDAGWTNWYYNLEDMEAGMYYGPFSYMVKFAYDGEPMENTDDFDFYEAFKDLKILSVTYDGLGDATNLE